MMGKYILEGHTPVLVNDLLAWAKRFGTADRRVEKTEVDGVEISTVFLGVDHGFCGTLSLFETMVFGGPLDGEQARYATWEGAELGHAAMVKRVKAAGTR
jgi:hypothetical protein